MIDLLRLFGIVLIRQRGRTHFLFAALIAHDADQIRAAKLQIVFCAKFV
jgi:hypothetical protein